ncbi:MAG: purine-nucleoside phosphorylase [Pseudomonadota bacterium]
MATKHMNAAPGDFAPTVLMPGDPVRAQYIAEKFLDDAREVTNVRNMLGFTGTYKGMPLSVMSHGMGIPSVSIYAHELIDAYGVQRLVRVGSCGTVQKQMALRDLVIAQGACTDSATNRMRFGGYDFACIADFDLLSAAVTAARSLEVEHQVGNVFTSDLFYTPDPDMFDTMERYRIYGVEMETAGLYAVAAELGVAALAMCTVSDHIRTGDALSSEERSHTFDDMIRVALATVIAGHE